MPELKVELATAHPAPAKPLTVATVGVPDVLVNKVGHSITTVLPVIAVIALLPVTATVQVEVAPAWSDPGVNVTVVGAVSAAIVIELATAT